jgi:hypothetical protein
MRARTRVLPLTTVILRAGTAVGSGRRPATEEHGCKPPTAASSIPSAHPPYDAGGRSVYHAARAHRKRKNAVAGSLQQGEGEGEGEGGGGSTEKRILRCR